MIKDILRYSFISSLTALFCCVAPSILFLLGLGSASFAFSFADAFYNIDEDGAPNIYSWFIRVIGILIILFGIKQYNKKESCSLNSPRQKKINKFIFGLILILFTSLLYYAWHFGSSWLFENYIDPARQKEYIVK